MYILPITISIYGPGTFRTIIYKKTFKIKKKNSDKEIFLYMKQKRKTYQL